MIDPPLPPDETQRLTALRSLGLLDTPIEGRFERITELAQLLLDMPIAAISLVDEDRQWFKSIRGLDAQQTERRVAFCAHTIADRDTQVVSDARENDRYRHNPLVTGDPGIVFYAGHPLCSAQGDYLGSLCVIDRQPRDFDNAQLAVLRRLARIAEQEINHPPADASVPAFVTRFENNLLANLTDPVTRLWNRHGMTAVLEHFLAQRNNTLDPVGMLSLTLDHYPALATQHGHETMDSVLRETARRITQTMWPADISAHLGDGRFLMAIQSGQPRHQVVGFAEQIKTAVDKLAKPLGLGPLGVATQTKIFVPNAITTAQSLLATDAPHANRPIPLKSA